MPGERGAVEIQRTIAFRAVALLLQLALAFSAPCREPPADQAAGVSATSEAGAALPMDISPDGELLLLVLPGGQGFELINTRTGQRDIVSLTANTGYFATVSPDKRHVCFKEFRQVGGRLFQMPSLYDIAQRKQVALCEPAPVAGNPAASTRGHIAYTLGEQLIVLNPDLSRFVEIQLGAVVNVLAFSPDGRWLAFSDGSETVSLLEVVTRARVALPANRLRGYQVWFSPDGQSLLGRGSSGEITACRIAGGVSRSFGLAASAAWIDNDTVALVRKAAISQGVRQKLILRGKLSDGSSDLLLARKGKADFAINAPVMAAADSTEIALGETRAGLLKALPIRPRSTTAARAATTQPADFPASRPLGVVTNPTTVELTGVPYIHQKYDTPDAFPGGSYCCNATAALMAIQYYGRLAARPITCSRGGTHTSLYGYYITSNYTYNGHTYNIPSSATWGADLAGYLGGFGYFLQDNPGGSWARSIRLSEYISYHGLTSSVDDGVTGETGITKARAEINANHPVVILNSIVSEGHYLTCIGYVKNQHTLIFNDPDGNKAQGYANWNGAGAWYDWPGYNNGYPNLNTVIRYVYARGTASPSRVISLGGDLAFGNVTVGMSAQRILIITNSGSLTLAVSNIAYPAGYSGNWSGAIPAGGVQSVTVTFSPTAPVVYTGNLVVSSDATAGINTRTLFGAGTPPPTLGFSRNGNQIVFTWPTNPAGFTLRSAASLPAAVWSPVSPAPVVVGNVCRLTNTILPGAQFYRLSYP